MLTSNRFHYAKGLALGGKLISGVLILFIVGSWATEILTLHPRHWTIGPTPATYGWAYQNVNFKDDAKITLSGWWIPGVNHKTVVMVHGWTSSRAEPMSKASYLHNAGYNLLVFDLRGHGQSSGDYTTMGYAEPNDLYAAVSFALSKDNGPIALFGYSLGGAIAIEEAANDSRVRAVIEDSAFSSLVSVVGVDFNKVTHLPANPFALPLLTIGKYDLGFDPERVQPLNAASHLHQPLLAIVGTNDQMVPTSQGYALYNAAKGNKQILVIKGAGHTQAYFHSPQLYKKTVLDFLANNLSRA